MSLTDTENGLVEGIQHFLQVCEKRWPADQPRPRVVTRVPGRLDVMGGMADFSGTLALQIPVERAVLMAAGRREDQKLRVESIGWQGDGPDACCEWPLSTLYQTDGEIVTAGALADHFADKPWVRHIAGICLALLESGDVPHFAGGVTLLFHSDIPPEAGLASSAAIQIATAKALGAVFDTDLDARPLLAAARLANTDVVQGPSNLVDHLTCLLGEPGALLQIRCQPDDVLGTVSLPHGVALAGVHTGVRLPIYEERYADNRAAALIGRFLIERILQAAGEPGDPTGGYLANIAPTEYVRRFRNELPVKLRGREFIQRFGQPDELDVTVQPEKIYKIRSRTEHHIYENDRTHRFVERLARARRTGERDALVEAGELMYASHWSYGQRCGMGSIETDVLVNYIRDRGAARGLYGAKATGGGCGGTVAVLMADAQNGRDALQEACDAYATKTGTQPSILHGSSPGAMAFGNRILD